MLEMKFIKQNPELFKKAMESRNKNVDVDALLSLDEKYRAMLADTEELRCRQNNVTKQIPILKKEGKDCTELLSEMKTISDRIKECGAKAGELEKELNNMLLELPNIPNERVPHGKDSGDNVEIKKVGEPKKFDFEPLPHWEIGKKLDILDPETAAKVTGARFHFYKGLGARLERAVINFYLDCHTKNGYTEIFPPFMVNRASMTGTGQLPKFEEDAFHLENCDYFLIPTAEVPVTNMYRDEILMEENLPIKYCAYSACFRAEAGSAGRDTRGLIRQHQFNKVELVKFCTPQESYNELESLCEDAQYILKVLGIPYRVVLLCSGDMGFASAMTYDIEVWMPSYGGYVEISSCSNFEDFQARRAAIRYKKDIKDKSAPVHTLNGSGVAIGRSVAAILENFQNADGTVTIPEALVPYMGTDKISPRE